MGSRASLLVFLALLSLTGYALWIPNCPCDKWVSPDESIQDAINAAPPGSVLCLDAGTWWENLVIDKSITLKGQGPERTYIRPKRPTTFLFPILPVISIRGGGTGFPISVMIEGITVIGSLEDYLPSSAGVQAIGMSQVIMRDCHVSEVLTGVELLDNAQAMLIRVTISGGERNLGGTGIDLLARSQAIVVDSKITWFGDGIAARMWAQIMVLHSTIKHARFGIHITEDAQAIMRDVLISNTDDGIIITERAQARIANCTLVDNGIGVGIFHYGSVTLLENVIARNRYYGVLVSLHNPRVWFRGFVMGANNAIPGPDEPNGNGYGAVFPEALGFLTTQIGGVFHKGT